MAKSHLHFKNEDLQNPANQLNIGFRHDEHILQIKDCSPLELGFDNLSFFGPGLSKGNK